MHRRVIEKTYQYKVLSRSIFYKIHKHINSDTDLIWKIYIKTNTDLSIWIRIQYLSRWYHLLVIFSQYIIISTDEYLLKLLNNLTLPIWVEYETKSSINAIIFQSINIAWYLEFFFIPVTSMCDLAYLRNPFPIKYDMNNCIKWFSIIITIFEYI